MIALEAVTLLPALAAVQQADIDVADRLAHILKRTSRRGPRAAVPPARPDWLTPTPLRPPAARPSKARREAAFATSATNQRGQLRLDDRPRNQGEALYGLNHVQAAKKRDAKAQVDELRQAQAETAAAPTPKKKRGRPRK